jgi:hypothetical protein
MKLDQPSEERQFLQNSGSDGVPIIYGTLKTGSIMRIGNGDWCGGGLAEFLEMGGDRSLTWESMGESHAN